MKAQIPTMTASENWRTWVFPLKTRLEPWREAGEVCRGQLIGWFELRYQRRMLSRYSRRLQQQHQHQGREAQAKAAPATAAAPAAVAVQRMRQAVTVVTVVVVVVMMMVMMMMMMMFVRKAQVGDVGQDHEPDKGHTGDGSDSQLGRCELKVCQMEERPETPVRLHAREPLLGVAVQAAHRAVPEHRVLEHVVARQVAERHMHKPVTDNFLQRSAKVCPSAKPSREEYVVDNMLTAAEIEPAEGRKGEVSSPVNLLLVLHSFLRHEVRGRSFDPARDEGHREGPGLGCFRIRREWPGKKSRKDHFWKCCFGAPTRSERGMDK